MYESLEILKGYSFLGEKILDDGTLLIAKAPHIAPLAWLHSIFPPLSPEDIFTLEEQLNGKIPASYKDFLLVTNGLKVFNTTLSLDGCRRNYKRDTISVWQPFDILTPNIDERPKNAEKTMFFIGGYDCDGSLLYIDNNTNKVHLCSVDDANSLYEWPSFDKMLESEINRLIGLFDKEGKEFRKDQNTLPI